MTMTFSQHDNTGPNGAFDRIDSDFYLTDANNSGKPVKEEFHILREKLRMSLTEGLIERSRINNLLRKSVDQFPATLISGRAGTGKTAVAAGFAAGIENVSWYSVESTDIEWPVFSKYFSASLAKSVSGTGTPLLNGSYEKDPSETEIARFLINRFSWAYNGPAVGPSLIVLDDIHHIFDATWFDDFFNLLLYSLPGKTHVLLLCRSKPPTPLWRLRSKQMLNVIDEKVIAFDADETKCLFDALGRPVEAAKRAHRLCFGRISKILEFAGDI